MAVTQKINAPMLVSSPKTGSHTHTCTRYFHQFDCQYSTKCHLEGRPAAQSIIDEMCPACFNLKHDNFAS